LRLDAEITPNAATLAAWQAAGDLPPGFGGTITLEAPVRLWVASAEYAYQGLLAAAEYSRWNVRLKSSEPTLVSESKTVSEGMYAMLSYQVTDWFTPGVYYAALFPDVKERHGRDAYRHDVAATLRYDLNAHWLLKLEGHYMHGTAGLSPTLNGAPPSGLPTDWGVFLAKTTAYF
jgi:predicted porin